MLLPRIIVFKFSSQCRQIDFQETVKFQILRLNVTGLKRTIHIRKNFTAKEIIKKIIENKKLPYSRLLDQQKC